MAREAPWFWLSFCDLRRNHLGVVILRAPDLMTAIARAIGLNCNPGGIGEGEIIPEQFMTCIPESARKRLLRLAESVPIWQAIQMAKKEVAN